MLAVAWKRVNTTLSEGLSPLNVPFHTLLSSEPGQDAGPDGPTAAALPVVAVGSGGFLALCLYRPSRVSTWGPKVYWRLD